MVGWGRSSQPSVRAFEQMENVKIECERRFLQMDVWSHQA